MPAVTATAVPVEHGDGSKLDVYQNFGVGVLVNVVGFAFVYAAAIAPNYDKKGVLRTARPTVIERLEAADLLFSFGYYALLFWLAAMATVELWSSNSLEQRWGEGTWQSHWFLQLYTARMIVHMPIQWVTLQADATLRLQMTLHHALSSLCFGAGLLSRRMHFWGVFAGCCEGTTVFLNALLCLKAFCDKDRFIVKMLGAAIGLGLWFSFIVLRLALFPVWLHMFATDIQEQPALTWQMMSFFERYIYPATILLLFVLSCIWMVPITKGLLKAFASTASPGTAKLE